MVPAQPKSSERFAGFLRTATSPEEFLTSVAKLTADVKDEMSRNQQRQTDGSLTAFGGEVRIPPPYASWLMQEHGSVQLHLRENKHPIGRPEAQALLSLKVTRGGPDRLRLLQQTVRSLLGVSIGAFEPDSRSQPTSYGTGGCRNGYRRVLS